VKPHQIKYLKSDIIGHKLQAHTDQANQKSDSHRPWVERRALGKYLLFMLCVIKFCVCVMQGVVWLGQSAGRQKTQWAIMESVMWPIDEWRVVFMPLQPGFVHTHTHARALLWDGERRIPTHLIPWCKFCTPLLAGALVGYLPLIRLIKQSINFASAALQFTADPFVT
jgi:hypothetical protein